MKIPTLLALAMIAQGPPQAPPVVPAPPQAPPPSFGNERPAMTYTIASKLAAESGRPLVVFIGVPPRQVSGTLTSTRTSLPGVAGPAVVIALPSRGWLYWKATLSADASDEDIYRAAGLEVRQAPIPFSAPPDPPTADVDAKRRRERLFKRLPFLAELVPYKRARMTQEIAVTDGRDRISSVPRSVMEAKWNAPGGLSGIDGWQSDLYKSVAGGRQWVGNIDVFNGANFQANRGWKRSYADGTVFADVLSYRGRTFEVRVAEKRDGVWDRYIAYKDVEARPPGYHGLKQSCASCHNEAGTGSYAAGLIPGGDTIISHSFDALE